jgi:hypothetical protein
MKINNNNNNINTISEQNQNQNINNNINHYLNLNNDYRHILISSITNLNNLFLNIDKEKIGDLSDKNNTTILNDSQSQNNNNQSQIQNTNQNQNKIIEYSSNLFEKMKKKFYEKNLLEIIDAIYLSSKNISLNKSNETDKKISDGTFYYDTKSPKNSIGDFNIKVNIGRNFLNEKLYTNKFHYENEKLKDLIIDIKINKLNRKIRQVLNEPKFENIKNFCIIYKDNFQNIENNLSLLNLPFTHINKGKSIYLKKNLYNFFNNYFKIFRFFCL